MTANHLVILSNFPDFTNLIYNLPDPINRIPQLAGIRNRYDPLRYDTMFAAKTVMLFGAGWMVLAFLILPAHASITPDAVLSVETFPLLNDQVPVRQAHLTWLAAKEETGMQVTIDYLDSINAPTARLSATRDEFHATAVSVSSITTSPGLDEALFLFRNQTRQFRDETDVQMRAFDGSAGELRARIHFTTDTSMKAKALEDTFWQTRERCELADFDLRVQTSQKTLDILMENGYETATAQEKLDAIVAMRSDLAKTLRTRDDAGIEEIQRQIHATSIELSRFVKNAQVHHIAVTA